MRKILLLPCLLLAAVAGGQSIYSTKRDSAALRNQTSIAERWYKNAIIYNLDVHTFQDSDGDGVGDFNGLTGRLSYLKELGVDVIWLAPFQPSPRKDDGYDITDYYGIDSLAGTPGDFANFMHRAHEMGIKVMMDVVFTHTSDEHPWFRQAAADSTSRYRGWYVWSRDKPANQHKGMAFPGVQTEIWTYNALARAYYYHRFYNFQPHLNYIDPAVQEECQHVLGYWLNQGISGFRVDAVPFMVEIPNKTSDKMDHDSLLIPALRQFVQWRKGDAALLGEANVLPSENGQYFGKNGEGLHAMFNFYASQYLFYGLATGDVTLFRRALQTTSDIDPQCQWVWFLRMHDEVDLGRLTEEQRGKVYAKMGPDKDMQLYDRGIRRRLAPMLHNARELELAYCMLFSLPGAAHIRYGEELGMGDDLRLKERLSVRTPMQWDHTRYAGFTTGARPFRPVIEGGEYDYHRINVEDESFDPASLLNKIRRFIALRKQCPEIGLGKWTIPDSASTHVLKIRYEYKGKALLMLYNLGDTAETVQLGDGEAAQGDREERTVQAGRVERTAQADTKDGTAQGGKGERRVQARGDERPMPAHAKEGTVQAGTEERTDLLTGRKDSSSTLRLEGYGYRWYRLSKTAHTHGASDTQKQK